MTCQFPETQRTDRSNRQIHDAIAGFLHDSFASDDRPLARIDRWSQQRITVANQGKLADILSAPNPVGRGIARLTSDIHAEASAGVLLATPAGNAAMLQRLAGESGLTGRLFQHLETIAPVLFADEFQQLGKDLSLMSANIEARFDRSNLDAEVSELILMYLLPGDETVADIADDLRKTLYGFHEDRIRRSCGLPSSISETSSQKLAQRVSNLLADDPHFSDRLLAG
jgi:hypothetical protein